MSVIPGEPPPLVDLGNVLLTAGLPCTLQTGLVPQPDGRQAGVATIRTPDASLTVTLDRAGVQDWIRLLTQLRDSLSGSGLIVAAPGQRVTQP